MVDKFTSRLHKKPLSLDRDNRMNPPRSDKRLYLEPCHNRPPYSVGQHRMCFNVQIQESHRCLYPSGLKILSFLYGTTVWVTHPRSSSHYGSYARQGKLLLQLLLEGSLVLIVPLYSELLDAIMHSLPSNKNHFPRLINP